MSALTPTQERVHDYIGESSGLSMASISTGLQLSQNTVFSAVMALEKRGLIRTEREKLPNGPWARICFIRSVQQVAS